MDERVGANGERETRLNRVECAHIRKDTEQIEFLGFMIEGIFIRSSTSFYMSA